MGSEANPTTAYEPSMPNTEAGSFISQDINQESERQSTLDPPLYSNKESKYNLSKASTASTSSKSMETLNRPIVNCFDILFSNFARLLYVGESCFCIYYIINLTSNMLYLFMLVPLLGICIDAAYVSFFRKGKEYYWGSISSFCYILIKLVTIWGIVVYRHDVMADKCFLENKEHIWQGTKWEMNKMRGREMQRNITEKVPFWRSDLKNVCPFLEIFVSLLIIVTIVGRLLYPIKKGIYTGDITDLLLQYFKHGVDIVDFFSYLDEDAIVVHYPTVLSILVFFSLSVTQFSFVFFARRTKDPKRTGFQALLDVVFGTEMWLLIFMLLFQEIPFFIIRVVILTSFEKTSKNYTLYFMGIKNITNLFISSHKMYELIQEDRKQKKEYRNNLGNSSESSETN